MGLLQFIKKNRDAIDKVIHTVYPTMVIDDKRRKSWLETNAVLISFAIANGVDPYEQITFD